MDALAVALVCSERPGIEMQVVRRVVAVDVRVFENIGHRAEHPEMSEGVLYNSEILASEGMC